MSLCAAHASMRSGIDSTCEKRIKKRAFGVDLPLVSPSVQITSMHERKYTVCSQAHTDKYLDDSVFCEAYMCCGLGEENCSTFVSLLVLLATLAFPSFGRGVCHVLGLLVRAVCLFSAFHKCILCACSTFFYTLSINYARS